MGDTEKAILHRVLKYAGGSLIEIVNDLLPTDARKLIDEWTDDDLNRSCKCDTLTCDDKGDPDEAVQSESFSTPYDVYSVENSLGIINVVALSEDAARHHVETLLHAVGERTGSTLTIDNVIKTIDVHVVIDGMGVVMTQLTQEELDAVANTPFEDA